MSSSYNTSLFCDHRHLLMSHHFEVHLTSDLASALQRAFLTSRYLPSKSFTKLIRTVIQTMDDEIKQEHFSAGHIATWFASLDSTAHIGVEYSSLVGALTMAAAMRKYPTVLQPSRPLVAKWTGSTPSLVIWLDSWRRLAICSSETNSLKLFSTTGEQYGKLDGHTASITSVEYIRAIGVVCTTSCDRIVNLWDNRKASPIATRTLPHPVLCCTHDHISNLIWLGLADGHIEAYSTNLKLQLRRSVEKHSNWVVGMLFLAELTLLVTCSLDRSIVLWNVIDASVYGKKLGHSRGCTMLTYVPQCKLLFSAGQGKEIFGWNPLSILPGSVMQLCGPHEREVVGLHGDLLNSTLISVDSGARCCVWDALHGVALQVLPPDVAFLADSPITCSAFNPVTRDVYLISVKQFLTVPSTTSALKPPRLGIFVKQLHFALKWSNLLVVVTEMQCYFFNSDDATLLWTLDQCFGPVAISSSLVVCDDYLCLSSIDHRTIAIQLQDVGNSKVGPLSVSTPFRHSLLAAFVNPLRPHHPIVSSQGGCALVSLNVLPHLLEFNHDYHSTILHADQEILTVRYSEVLSCVAMITTSKRQLLLWAVQKNTLQNPILENIADIQFLEKRNALVAVDAALVLYILAPQATMVPTAILIKNEFSARSLTSQCCVVITIKCCNNDKLVSDLGVRKELHDSLPQLFLTDDASSLCDEARIVTVEKEGFIADLDLAPLFEEFFRAQKVSMDLKQAEELKHARRENSMFAVQQSNWKETSTSVLDVGVDCRTGNVVVLKKHHQCASHKSEVALRNQLADLELQEAIMSTKKSPSISTFQLPTVSSGETAETSLFVRYIVSWCAEDENISKGSSPNVIAMECGERTLHDVMVSQRTPSIPMPIPLEGRLEELDSLAVFLLRLCNFLEGAALVVSDLRPRCILQVASSSSNGSNRWRLCGLDAVVDVGSTCRPGVCAAYLAPELCIAPDTHHRLRPFKFLATHAMNLWTAGLMLFEATCGTRLLSSLANGATMSEETVLKALHTISPKWVELQVQNSLDLSVAKSSECPHLAWVLLSNWLKVDPLERTPASQLMETYQDAVDVILHRTPTLVTNGTDTPMVGGTTPPTGHLLQAIPLQLPDGVVPTRSTMCTWNIHQIPRVSHLIRSTAVLCKDVQAANNRRRGGNVSQTNNTSAQRGSLVFVADCNPDHLGHGSITLLGPSGEFLGHLPPPEIGEDKQNKWKFPFASRSIPLTTSSPLVERSVDSNVDDIVPVRLLSDLTMAEVEVYCRDQVGGSSRVQDKVRSPSPTMQDSSEAYVRFVSQLLRKAPFFKGGNVDGDHLPIYCEQAQRATMQQKMEATSEYDKRRRQRKQHAVEREQRGGVNRFGAPVRKNSRLGLTCEFLTSVPPKRGELQST